MALVAHEPERGNIGPGSPQKKVTLTVRVLPDGKPITLDGRQAWVMNLRRAGSSGCMPLDTPGPRWWHYVWRLRHEYSIGIETIHEPHGGPFAGSHTIVRSEVVIVDNQELAA